MGQARMRGLERAARQLGVTSAILRQQGWRTALPARVKAAAVDAGWAPEVSRAEREARQLAGELAPGQVRARTARNGTPATRRPATAPGGSCGGRRG